MYFKVIACVLVVFSVVSSCNCAKSPEEYLQVETNFLTDELRWISRRIESGSWGKDIETVASNLDLATKSAWASLTGNIDSDEDIEKLGVGTYDENKLSDLRWALSGLLSFSSEDSFIEKCSNGQASAFIELVDLQFGSLKKFQKSLKNPPSKSLIFKYLEKYGNKIFKECQTSLLQRFEEALQTLPAELEVKLDTLISMGEQYQPAEEADVHLASQAEKADLAHGKFDAKKLLSAVTHFMDESEISRRRKSGGPKKILSWFIVKTCQQYRSRFPLFDMYNLARMVVPETESEMSPKFKKLNELSRICIPFTNHLTRDKAESNVGKNMPIWS